MANYFRHKTLPTEVRVRTPIQKKPKLAKIEIGGPSPPSSPTIYPYESPNVIASPRINTGEEFLDDNKTLQGE